MQNNPKDRKAEHVAVLSLVQGGALETAQRLYSRYELESCLDDEDIISLGGRIYKDLAQESSGAARLGLLRKSLLFYKRAYAETGGTYSLVNTATLSYLCQETKAARALARTLLSQSFSEKSQSPSALYWYHASRAEAFLICEDLHACQIEFELAIAADPQNFVARATTVRQFKRLFAAGAPAFELSGYRPPSTLHFCGHLYGGPSSRSLSEKQVKDLETQIQNYLDKVPVSHAFGALAAGSDILIAESLLSHGADLHAVLPVSEAVFKRLSVVAFGEEWADRYDRCIAAASSVTITNSEATSLDDLEISLASQIAMGKACLRAEDFGTTAAQLAIRDNGDVRRGGTAADVLIWKATARHQTVIPWPQNTPLNSVAEPKAAEPVRRQMAAMLFADLVGFSRLPDAAQPAVIEAILRPLAETVMALETPAIVTDSWGDGIFLAYESIEAAAIAALSMQSKFSEILATLPTPLSELSLRIGGHCGPVFGGLDPFRHRETIYGRNVVTASRIEPLTLPGSVFVSEPMACILTAFHAKQFKCDYVGMMQPEKNHPPLRLFSLRNGPRRN